MNSDFISKCCNTHNSHIRTLFGSIIEIGHELAKTLHNSSFHHKAKTCQCTYAAVGQTSCIQFHFKIKLLLHKLCNTFFLSACVEANTLHNKNMHLCKFHNTGCPLLFFKLLSSVTLSIRAF